MGGFWGKIFKKKHDYDHIPCIIETGIKDKNGEEIWATGYRCKLCGNMLIGLKRKEDLYNLPDNLKYGCKGKIKRR